MCSTSFIFSRLPQHCHRKWRLNALPRALGHFLARSAAWVTRRHLCPTGWESLAPEVTFVRHRRRRGRFGTCRISTVRRLRVARFVQSALADAYFKTRSAPWCWRHDPTRKCAALTGSPSAPSRNPSWSTSPWWRHRRHAWWPTPTSAASASPDRKCTQLGPSRLCTCAWWRGRRETVAIERAIRQPCQLWKHRKNVTIS